jgi:hypothetical protein
LMERPLTTTEFRMNAPVAPAVRRSIRSRNRRLTSILVMIPLAAATIAAGVLVNKPTAYESTLRVVIPDELGMGSGAIGLYVANLEQRLVDPKVVDRVVAETSVRPVAYVSRIRLNRLGQSSDAQFSFVDRDPDVSRAVVETAASAALQLMAEEGLPFAKREVRLADKQYREVVRALDAFRVKHAVSSPEQQYWHVATQLEAAQDDLERARAQDATAARAKASETAERLEKDRDRLRRMVSRYQQLDDERAIALTIRSRARDRLARQQTEIRLTDQANLRRDTMTHQVSRLALVLQGAAASAAVALVLELAVIVLPDVVRSGRRATA